jgi:hypothetical protein
MQKRLIFVMCAITTAERLHFLDLCRADMVEEKGRVFIETRPI